MMIPALSHREIGHSNIQFISLPAIQLISSILSTSSRWVSISVLLGKVPHIVNRFTTAVTVTRNCNLIRISTLTTPATPTTATPTCWKWSSLGGSGHGIIHISAYSLTHHGLKHHRLSQEVSLISSGNCFFISRCIRPRARGTAISINKFLVLRLRRPNYFLKFQTIHHRDLVQVHVLCLEAKFRYDLILIQVQELKCRAGAPIQRTSQARDRC